MKAKGNILIAGAGHIGCALASLLASQKARNVILVDKHVANIPNVLSKNPAIEIVKCDISNATLLFGLIQKKSVDAIVSCLPYFCNFSVAEVAKANHCHYFDFTEDVATTRDIFALAKNASTAFVPQCGIAPGFINIVANHLIQQFDEVSSAKIYCGALPQSIDNALGYALTWSTEGLINEYGNLCRVLQNGKKAEVPGLSHCETLSIKHETYEAFHTSGGIGTLIDTYANKIDTLFYKTLRYPGHVEKMRFLMEDLKLNEDRKTLKRILERALPTTDKDVVITHVTVEGKIKNKNSVLTDTRHFYPNSINEQHYTAIQAVTTAGASVVIDTVLSDPDRYQGPIKQEDFDLETILSNALAAYLKTGK